MGQGSDAGALQLTSGWGWAPVTASTPKVRSLKTQSCLSEASGTQAEET